MFKTERMIPRTAFDGAKVDSACADDDDVEIFTGSRGRLFVHCKVGVQR
jgi:hypothetical protein